MSECSCGKQNEQRRQEMNHAMAVARAARLRERYRRRYDRRLAVIRASERVTAALRALIAK